MIQVSSKMMDFKLIEKGEMDLLGKVLDTEQRISIVCEQEKLSDMCNC